MTLSPDEVRVLRGGIRRSTQSADRMLKRALKLETRAGRQAAGSVERRSLEGQALVLRGSAEQVHAEIAKASARLSAEGL